MDVEIANFIKDLIGNFGFPVVCCFAMYWQNMQERKTHQEESAKWVEALNNNTQALTAIKERLSK